MKLTNAKEILPELSKFIGTEVKSKGLKISKFLIIPLYKVGEFIQSYTIRQWNEDKIIEELFSQETDFDIICQFESVYPNIQYIYLADFINENKVNIN